MRVQHREVGQVGYSKASQLKDKKNINSMLKSYLIKQQQLITQFRRVNLLMVPLYA